MQLKHLVILGSGFLGISVAMPLQRTPFLGAEASGLGYRDGAAEFVKRSGDDGNAIYRRIAEQIEDGTQSDRPNGDATNAIYRRDTKEADGDNVNAIYRRASGH
ncbi:MAG: hypothetical protein M1822_004482 [Bathelium mastoideum]|nr:MAG: hypothetical protein M1822_004482 [Bathelium mastoideum]